MPSCGHQCAVQWYRSTYNVEIRAEAEAETSKSSSQSLIPNSQFRSPGHDAPLSSLHGFTNVLVTIGSDIYRVHQKLWLERSNIKYFAYLLMMRNELK